MVRLFTIGFTQRSAEDFYGTLKRENVVRLIDVRLNNSSQLSGFAKREDLRFFLREICGADYVHELRLAPEPDDLKSYRAGGLSWEEYERRYVSTLRKRGAENLPRASFVDRSVLLCSERRPAQCHRRLAAEYLAAAWGDVEIVHL
jgi:uncharacterized protein (DUF488 family)